jgi:hypothetical protein
MVERDVLVDENIRIVEERALVTVLEVMAVFMGGGRRGAGATGAASNSQQMIYFWKNGFGAIQTNAFQDCLLL